MKKYKPIPYYTAHKNFRDQVKKSSKRREMSPFVFLLRKIRNHLFQSLAYNCPINSVRVWLHRKRGVNIGKGVVIGLHCVLDNAHPEYIYIEVYASLAGNVYVLTHSNPFEHFSSVLDSYLAPVIVRKGVWVGVSSTLLSGCEIGAYTIVSAGSVVSGKIPEKCVVRGNPAKVVVDFELE